MIEKVLRYTCDRCGYYQDFTQGFLLDHSPFDFGWKSVRYKGRECTFCKDCYKKFGIMVDDFVKKY